MIEDKKVAAIILSHLRPFNIQKQCDTFLKIGKIAAVIISNNNPDIKLQEYVTASDDRVKMIDQLGAGPIRRFEIASRMEADYYICIDDDLFLEAPQIDFLLEQLIENPASPHGFWGQNINESGNEIFFINGIINSNTKVDILNRAYFLTSAHAKELIRLIAETNVTYEDVNGPCDDVYLSFSGNEKPFSHYIGSYKDCPTSNEHGIAQWTGMNFESKRANVVNEILKIKRFDH